MRIPLSSFLSVLFACLTSLPQRGEAQTSLRARPGSPRTAVRPAESAPSLSAAQLSGMAAERAQLVAGVRMLPRFGVPGPVVAYGPAAFPLVVAGNPQALEALAAAGSMGKGRVVIFGHTSYLGGEAGSGDLDRLLLNAVRWCGRKPDPRVGIKGAKTAALLETQGLPTDAIRVLDKSSLARCDVLIASAQGLTDPAEAAALRDYIEKGGGYIGAVTGWAFVQTSGGKDFATAHRGNAALAGAGLAWTEATLAEGELAAPAELPPQLHALGALAAISPSPGAAAQDPAALRQAARTLQLALASAAAEPRLALQKALAGVLSRADKVPVPTPETPLVDGEPRAMSSLQSQLLRLAAPEDIRPHPAAGRFPGRAGSQARTVVKTLVIDPAVPGWQSTGLYADAGALIRVKCPPEAAATGYALRIGCHTDRLHHLDSWKRMPEITTVAPLRETVTAAANPFGGLVYLVVPEKAKQTGPFEVAIAGGIEAPLFELGRTTDSQWQQMRKLAAPWAELACKGVVLSVPVEVARDIRDPAGLMTFWQRVIEAQDELAGTAGQRRRPERIVPDVQISAGYMHSGYPIMIHLPQAGEMVTFNSRQWPGWGFYHELGHNHQKPEWTFEGTGEVTCNLFSLYIFEAVLGVDKTTGHGQVSAKAQAEQWRKHQQAGAPFAAWKSDPFLALTCYIQLLDAFGFDALKKVFRSYQGGEFGPLPKTDDEKRDQWMVRYSKVVGKNLGPFFKAWGIPVSSAAREEIASLPAWMPAG